MKEKNVIILFCPPKSQYPSQPSDVSLCTLFDCPTCKKPMWLSEKKKGIIAMAEAMGSELLLECFICFEKTAKKNPEIFRQHNMVKI